MKTWHRKAKFGPFTWHNAIHGIKNLHCPQIGCKTHFSSQLNMKLVSCQIVACAHEKFWIFFVFFFFYTLTTTKQSVSFTPFFLFVSYKRSGYKKSLARSYYFYKLAKISWQNKMPCPIIFLYFFVLCIGATMNQHPPAHHLLDATFIGWGTYVIISTLVF